MLGKKEYLELRSEYINPLLDCLKDNFYDKQSHIIDNDYLDQLRSGITSLEDIIEGINGWMRVHQNDIPIDTFLVMKTYLDIMITSLSVQQNDINNYQNLVVKIYSSKDNVPEEQLINSINSVRERLYGLIIGFINQFSSLVAHLLDKLKVDNIEHRNISEKMFDQIFPYELIGRMAQ